MYISANNDISLKIFKIIQNTPTPIPGKQRIHVFTAGESVKPPCESSIAKTTLSHHEYVVDSVFLGCVT